MHTQETATWPKFNLRLQPELRKAVTAAAKESGRSVNAEINHRLRRSFEGYRQ